MNKSANTQSIDWREWDQAAFLAARREAKPVLLTLTATWCHWCHVMDETSYSDARVISLVNSEFIPVSVDVDRRPDISRRFNQGGFPSVAVLDEQANLIAGRTYTPPDQMARFLEGIVAKGPGVPSNTGNKSSNGSSGPLKQRDGEIHDPPTTRVLRRLQDLYDPDFGGFGREPKQPPWEALRFLMALYSRSGEKPLLSMITTTLDGMRVGLYDQMEQGFFRYSVARDWRVPHYEKMIVTNANLAMLCLEAYQLTGRKAYKDLAVGCIDFLLGPLYDETQGVFYASQDAWEDYYRLPWKDRTEATKPTIDTTVYTGWNALAASALINAYGALEAPKYLKAAAGVLDRLWSDSWNSERGLDHLWGESTEHPTGHPIILEDQVHFLRALLSLHQATGHEEHLKRATEVAICVQELFGASDGGFYDTSEGLATSDNLLLQEKPVLENSLLAEALVSLAYLKGEDQNKVLARNTLETFETVVPGNTYLGSGSTSRMEEDEEELFLPAGSAWARAWDMLSRGSAQMVVVGGASNPDTKNLLRAARKVYAPHRIVQSLDPECDDKRIASLGFPARDVPALYACVGNMCLAPITNYKEVKSLLTAHTWPSTQPS